MGALKTAREGIGLLLFVVIAVLVLVHFGVSITEITTAFHKFLNGPGWGGL